MHDSGMQGSPAHPEVIAIEHALPRSTPGIDWATSTVSLIVVGGALGLAITLQALRVHPVITLLTVVPATGAITALVYALRRRYLKDLRTSVQWNIKDRGPRAALQALRHTRGGQTTWLTQPVVAEELVRAGWRDHTVRIGPAVAGPQTVFTEWFEARRLAEKDAGFAELAAATDGTVGHATRPTRPARWRSRVLFRGLQIVMVYGFARMMWNLFRQPSALRDLLPQGGLAVCLIGALALFQAYSTAWFVVPGGVLLRRIRLFGPTDLHCVDRRNSVLIAVEHPLHAETWRVAIADPHVAHARSVTTRELDVLLRAWLSPLPPLPIEALTDLR